MASTYTWSLVSGTVPPGGTLSLGETDLDITLVGPFTTPGVYTFRVRIENDISGAAHEKTYQITVQALTITGGIFPATTLGGSITPSDEGSVLSTPPLLVFGLNIESTDDLDAQNVPDGKPFLVSANFAGTTGNAFYDAGARQNYIGIRNGSSLRFRAPVDREQVWYIQVNDDDTLSQGNFYRFFAKSTPVWHLYHPWPERAINGQYAFELLDPDRIYEYYGRLTSQLGYDLQELNRQLSRLLDPAECREDFLDLLAEQHGIALNLVDAPDVQRKKLRELLRVPRVRGTVGACIVAFRHENYWGLVYEVWADPEDVTNWEDVVDAPASVVTHMTAIGILDDQITESGQKGIDYVVVPHGFYQVTPAPGNFYPTGRVAVVLANLDRSPIGLASLTYDQVKEIADRIAAALDAFLPAHADIRMLVESFPVADVVEELEVDDELTVTSWDYALPLTPVLGGSFVVT